MERVPYILFKNHIKFEMQCLDIFLVMFDDHIFLTNGNEVWNVNNIRFRFLIISGHEKFPTFTIGIKIYFLLLDFKSANVLC